MFKDKILIKRILIVISILTMVFGLFPLLLTTVLQNIHPIITERSNLFKIAAQMTARLAFCSGVIGFFVGVAVGVLGLNGTGVLKWIARIYVWVICGTPLLIQVLFFYYALPVLIPGIEISEITAGMMALSLNIGAYNSSVIKSGLDAVPKSQAEAAISLGLSRLQSLRFIVFPQAVRIALAPLMNNWISLLKDTSLVSSIGVVELTLAATRTNSETFLPLPTLITIAIIYLTMSTVMNICVFILKPEKI